MRHLQTKRTAETSSDSSVELPYDKTEDLTMTKKQRVALAAGSCGLLALACIIAVVTILFTNGFDFSKSTSPVTVGTDEDSFDFVDVNPSETDVPEDMVTITEAPSLRPQAVQPTMVPAVPAPVANPTSPTLVPSTLSPTAVVTSTNPTEGPTYDSTELCFCVIADVPYFESEAIALPNQIATQMEGCEFMVHLGDIMKGEIACDEDQFLLIKDLMLESEVPTFVVPGDNEWNDCGDRFQIEAAWVLWKKHLLGFENHWTNHTFDVVRNFDYPENFYFLRRRTLIIGLNIVGGRVHDATEWLVRLSSEVEWIRELVLMNVPQNADGVIIMAHSKPTVNHQDFFGPLAEFVGVELGNEVPVLYLHGDGHSFVYTQEFLEQPNFLRIQHEGGVRDPILKIYADPHALGPRVTNAFTFDRQLHLEP